MIQVIWFSIYLFETCICCFFFENFYSPKANKLIRFIAYALSLSVQYGFNLLGNPNVNITTFFICYFLIALLCYESKLKSAFFSCVMLTVLMMITEVFVIAIFSVFYKTPIDAYKNVTSILVAQSSLVKLLLFVLVVIITKFSQTKKREQKTNKYMVLLGIPPLTSTVILILLMNYATKNNPSDPYDTVMMLCAVLLLFTNFFVFYVYEAVQKSNYENTQFYLQQQKDEVSREYYELLSSEYQKSRILVHDIKNHLQYISDRTINGESQEVIDYIDSISEDFGLNAKIIYSGNKLVDVILNRYAHECKEKGLKLDVESCGSKLDFMSESDITALLDNMFDNAIEAAKKSITKEIVFLIYRKSSKLVTTDYVVINMSNSCDSQPKSINGKLLSSKHNHISHGIGTKSIKRVVDKYNGNFDWSYDSDNKRFEVSVILDINVRK